MLALARSWRVRTPLLVSRSLSTVPWTPSTTKPSTRPVGCGPYAEYLRQFKPIEREYRQFELLPTLLKIYRETTGHMAVPRGFKIPTKEELMSRRKMPHNDHVCGLVSDVSEIAWPAYVRGFNLGAVLDKFLKNSDYYMRYPSILAELRELGVDGTRREYEWKQQTQAALQVFYERHGHTLVPGLFEVPRGDTAWPVATWGLRLGQRVHTIRAFPRLLTDGEREDLKTVEFSFDVDETTWSDHIVPSLEMFHQLRRHCRIPQSFVVPSEDPWPKKLRGLPLGVTVNSIRTQGTFAAQVARDATRLKNIGFVWDHFEHQWSERILPSLEVFARVNGHCCVPKAFVVPSEEPWPEAAWGLDLGVIVCSMRIKLSYVAQAARDAPRLEKIKFVWYNSEYQWSERVLPSLETYRRLNGHCRVPKAFVVPSTAEWPQKAWGLNLGVMVINLRVHGNFSKLAKRDRDRLEAIGFAWDAFQDKWDKVVLPAFETFHRINGHCRIPQTFVVPADAEWPEAAWRLNIGRTYSNIRYRGDYSEQRKQDQARLDAIGFEVKNQ